MIHGYALCVKLALTNLLVPLESLLNQVYHVSVEIFCQNVLTCLRFCVQIILILCLLQRHLLILQFPMFIHIITSGYNIFRKDRDRHGGGVLVMVCDSYTVVRRHDLENACEML